MPNDKPSVFLDLNAFLHLVTLRNKIVHSQNREALAKLMQDLDLVRIGLLRERKRRKRWHIGRLVAIPLKKCVLKWSRRRGAAVAVGRVIGGWPQVAQTAAVAGMSLASLRRFWAVAARWNSSRAPFGPRNRSRSSRRMRLAWANSISTFFRSRREMT
jgi:hypothetical protein